MYARVTLLEIDTMRESVEHALEQFRAHTLPRLHEQPGYCGINVLTTPDGKAMLVSFWDTEAQAEAQGDHTFYAQELGRYATLFRAPPGRDRYEVAVMEEPAPTR